MAHGVGTAITARFSTGTAGESFTANKSKNPAGASWLVSGDVDDLSDGDYQIAFTPTAAGNWYARLTGDESGAEVVLNYDVVTASQADPVAALGSNDITVVSPINAVGDIEIVAGDAASIPWTSAGWDDLTGATVTFQAYKLITDTAVFASAKAVTKTSVGGASQTVTLALLGTDTDDFTPGIAYRYELTSTAGTLASGTLSAREG